MVALGVEIAWLIFIAAFAACSVYPIYGIIADEYINITIIVAMLSALFFRLAVFFRQVPWLRFLPVQIILFLLNPVLFIVILNQSQDMVFLFDSYDLLHFMVPGLDADIYDMNESCQLFRKEFLLFSVGLLILIALAELRITAAFVKRIREME